MAIRASSSTCSTRPPDRHGPDASVVPMLASASPFSPAKHKPHPLPTQSPSPPSSRKSDPRGGIGSRRRSLRSAGQRARRDRFRLPTLLPPARPSTTPERSDAAALNASRSRAIGVASAAAERRCSGPKSGAQSGRARDPRMAVGLASTFAVLCRFSSADHHPAKARCITGSSSRD